MDNSAKLFVVVVSHKHKNLSIRDEGSWQNPQLSPLNPLVLLMMTLKGIIMLISSSMYLFWDSTRVALHDSQILKNTCLS